MHRWPFVVAFVLTSCAGSTAADPISPDAAAFGAMLDVRSQGCGPRTGFGTATLIDEDVALTAAHVVAGAGSVSVIDLRGVEHGARVVWFDPDLDLAALLVPAGLGTPVAVHRDRIDDVERGAVAVSRGAFDDRVVKTIEVEVVRQVNVTTTDIYLDSDVVRPGFEVAGPIEPGDSGTMVVTAGGAAGVVWSRSNQTAGRAWAVAVPDDLTSSELRRSPDTDVDRGPCLP